MQGIAWHFSTFIKISINGNDGFSQKCYRHDDTVHLELHVAVR